MHPNHIDPNQEKKNQWITFIALLSSVVIGVIVLISFVHKDKSVSTSQKDEKLKFETPMLHVNDEKYILEKAQRRASDAEKKASELEQKIVDISQTQTKMVEEFQHRMGMLEKNMQAKREENAMTASLDPLIGQVGESNNPGQMIRRDKLNLVSTSLNIEERKQPIKTPNTYVPAGTFVQGVIIEGADTSAGVNAQANPEPMLIRLTSNGTLPNRHHSYLKDCVVTLAASGDISSERGKIRTERLSCVKHTGGIIDIPVEGNVAGSDGKNGMRGNPVWRENALLQRAFTAGALSGLSEGLSQTYTTNSISPLGSTQTTNNGKILQVGVARGTGKAMDKLADYNIQRAEQYHPVIQLSAGTVVDVVFLKGFFLDGKRHNENEEEQQEVQTKPVPTHSFFPSTQNSQLPLTPEQVARLDERSKELGLRVKRDET